MFISIKVALFPSISNPLTNGMNERTNERAGPTSNDKQMVIATGSGESLALRFQSTKARDIVGNAR